VFPVADTKSAPAIAAFVEKKFSTMYPSGNVKWLDRVFRDVERLFKGEHPDYCAVDLGYHDLEHTLQATLCLTLLIEGREMAGVAPRIDARHFELAMSAVLLHDCGYLKLRSDKQGTGAKYTFCHVLRSCAFAATYLPRLGANDYEVESVMAAINCTGPMTEISRLRFREQIERVIGSALGTADYLGQMAAPDYPDELEILYREFEESDDFLHIPRNRRMFKSAEDLAQRTPQFWYKFVRPKLETDFQAVYRFLARPTLDGENPYLDCIESNISKIQARCAEQSKAAGTSGAGPTPRRSGTRRSYR
jgi:hypothetical protein